MLVYVPNKRFQLPQKQKGNARTLHHAMHALHGTVLLLTQDKRSGVARLGSLSDWLEHLLVLPHHMIYPAHRLTRVD
jgi:hypothetical protein